MSETTLENSEPNEKKRCRVCLKNGDISISSKTNPLDFPFSHYLKLICSIEITDNDTYPKYLCKTCCGTLETAIILRKTAIRSQLRLKAISLSHDIKNILNQVQIKLAPDMVLAPVQIKTEKLKKEVRNTVQPKVTEPLRSGIEKADDDDEVEPCSPLRNEETDNNSDKANETENILNEQLLPLSQEKNVNSQFIGINQNRENFEIPPKLTLEQLEKFKAKNIPYYVYYQKVIIQNTALYKCRICQKELKKCSITEHLWSHVPDSVFQYICEVCGKSFRRFCNFHQHRIVHKNLLPFKCKFCPYKGRSKDLLNVHNKRVHKKEYNYQCTLCPRKFLDTNNLRYHLRRHEEPKFKCRICGKAFYENSALKDHIRMHMDTVPIKCELCGNLFKRRKNLLAHEIKVHKRKQVYNNRATYLKLESVSAQS